MSGPRVHRRAAPKSVQHIERCCPALCRGALQKKVTDFTPRPGNPSAQSASIAPTPAYPRNDATEFKTLHSERYA